MQTVTLSVGDKPYTVTACVVLCGKDIAVVIGGGEASHIGSDDIYIDILILLLSLDTYTSTQKALTNVRAFCVD